MVLPLMNRYDHRRTGVKEVISGNLLTLSYELEDFVDHRALRWLHM